jgi:hypothetical protein
MVQILIDPMADDTLDVGKIEDHPALVQRVRLDHDHRSPVVSMQILAFPLVVKQTVAVAKINLAGNTIHRAMHLVQFS